MNTLRIDVTFDFICPWCLIGKRNLDKAIHALKIALPQIAVDVRWHGVQLLPFLPEDGVPFADFYRQRLGSDEAVRRRQSEVMAAATHEGVNIDLTKIPRMPNTKNAHRLFVCAQQVASSQAQIELLLERMFAAYFVTGEDLGDCATLLAIASSCGFPIESLEAGLHDTGVFRSVASVNGVPHFSINQSLQLAGAQPPETIYAVLLEFLEESPA